MKRFLSSKIIAAVLWLIFIASTLTVWGAFTRTYNIIDSPRQQTVKQAILWLETDFVDLITYVNRYPNGTATDLVHVKSGGTSLDHISTSCVLVGRDTDAPTQYRIYDTDAMTESSATALATQQSIKAYADSKVISGATSRSKFKVLLRVPYDGGTGAFVAGERAEVNTGGGIGYVFAVSGSTTQGTLFIEKDDAGQWLNNQAITGSTAGAADVNGTVLQDTIVIYPGAWHHSGTTNQLVYSTDKIYLTFSSLAASDWYYVYINDAAVVAGGDIIITKADLSPDTTEPEWVDSKLGLYHPTQTGDRCILAVRTDAGSQLIDHYFPGGSEYIAYSAASVDVNNVDIDAQWSEQTLTMPSFATRAKVIVYASTYGAGIQTLYARPHEDKSWAGDEIFHVLGTDTDGLRFQVDLNTDDSQKIDLKTNVSDSDKFTLQTRGYYLPQGM